MGATEVVSGEGSVVGQDDLTHDGMRQVGAGEVGAGQVGLAQVGMLQVGASEVGAGQVSSGQVGMVQVGVSEIGADKGIVAAHVGARQHGIHQVAVLPEIMETKILVGEHYCRRHDGGGGRANNKWEETQRQE